MDEQKKAMRLLEFGRRLLQHRYLPFGVAIAGVLFMAPALNSGLSMDDLVQRTVQLPPEQLPSRLRDTGVALESGTLPAVLRNLFGFSRSAETVSLARNYGVLAWWTREDFRAALWRPAAAFTHWVDYRLFPDSPFWMHAHSIAWFGAILFLVATLYRQLIAPAWAAGLAAVLFLCDKNTYFPVMFVANRGFMLALFFGLVCLHEHHLWRTKGSRRAAILAALALAVSLLCNEAGASTLAFLLAYAFALEKRRLQQRVFSLLPTLTVIVLWRVVYESCGFGLKNVRLYIDPVHEPLAFLAQTGQRSLALLAGQFTGVAPDLISALDPSLRAQVFAACGLLLTGALVLLFPLLRNNRTARFWFSVTVLAAIPASTVVPLGKNLGFVAVGAFGLVALFVAGWARGEPWTRGKALHRFLVAGSCTVLLLAHIPGALVGKVMSARMAPVALNFLTRLGEVDAPGLGEQDVVVVNAPCQLAFMAAPFTRAYRGQDLPHTMRALAPAGTSLNIRRVDDRTLELKATGGNIFACDPVGPMHTSYAFRNLNLIGANTFQPGSRVVLNGLEAVVQEATDDALPASVTFQFELPLESTRYRFLCFDWGSFSYRHFEMPASGQSVCIPGPQKLSFKDFLRRGMSGGAIRDAAD